MDKNISITADRLRGFSESLLSAAGFIKQDAQAIAGSLVLSELTGHGSHGVMRLAQYIDYIKTGELFSGVTPRIVQETPASILVDAGFGIAQAALPGLLRKLQEKLETQAVASMAVCQCGHIGRLGEWVEGPAMAGYPALLMANDNGVYMHVAPPGGRQAATSTNPVAFAIPLPDGNIFVTDMSTSAIAFGKVRLAHLTGGRLPPDSIQDANGKPTTDPGALFTDPPGTVMPMGGAQGYKGFALAMFVDMLAAGLSGGFMPPAPAETKYSNNFVLTLWNPKFFAGLAHMTREAAKFIDFVRASPPVEATKPIRLAGDRMDALKRERKSRGVPLARDLAGELLALAGKLGVKPPPELVKR